MQRSLKSAAGGPTRVDLTWELEEKAIHAVGDVSVWRSEDHKAWTRVARVPTRAGRYSDTKLKPNALYFYCLSAAGTPAATFYGNDSFTVTIPNRPHYLAAVPFEGDVILTWSRVSQPHDGYEIFGSSDGKSWHVVAAVDEETTSYRDWSAADGVTDYYQVFAFGLFGDFAPSGIASATEDLPAGSRVTLSVPNWAKGLVKVYDRVPDPSGRKLLFGGDTGKDAFTWTVGDSPEPPLKAYGVGPDTPANEVVFTLSVTVGQATLGTASTSQPATAPDAP